MPKYLTSVSFAALLIAAPIGAFAQDKDTEVEGVVATGTLDVDGVKADKIGGSLTVITAADIENRQVRIISDVLRDVPGVAVSRSGAPGSLTAVRIRGAEGNHTLMLIDGIKASDPFQGEFDFASLIGDDVARVEVLRGQQSALYGSDAIAGVVHYITPSGKEAPGFRLRAEGGSFGTYGGSARGAGVTGDLDYVFTGAFQSTQGYPTQTDGKGKRDVGAENDTYGVKVNYRATDALRFRGVVRASHVEADSNNAPFAQGSLVRDSPGTSYTYQNYYYLGAADLLAMDGKWTTTAEVQGVETARESFSAFAFTGRNDGARIRGRLVTTFRVENGDFVHKFTAQADIEQETYQGRTSTAFGTEREVDNTGFVADYGLEYGPSTGFGASIRQDQNDLFQDATTYRVQAYHTIADMVRVRAAAGTGIKNPTQFELFGFGSTFVGNAALLPEKSEGWEVGTDLILIGGKARIGATYFDSKLTDEIFSFFGGTLPPACPAPGAGKNTVCNRTTDSTQKGFEFYAHAKITDQWSVDGSFTDLDANENNVEEIRRAPNIASASVNWAPTDAININLTVRYNGKQQDSNFSILTPAMFDNDPDFTVLPGGKVELPAFTLVNIAGSYKLNDKVEFFGRVENALDEDYYEVITFRTPGRAFYAGVRGRF